MEVQNSIPCVKCPKTMVKVGSGRRSDELVEIHYHCWSCHTQLTVNAKTGEHEGRFSSEALVGLQESGVLRTVGSTALAGATYPWSRVPKPERSMKA